MTEHTFLHSTPSHVEEPQNRWMELKGSRGVGDAEISYVRRAAFAHRWCGCTCVETGLHTRYTDRARKCASRHVGRFGLGVRLGGGAGVTGQPPSALGKLDVEGPLSPGFIRQPVGASKGTQLLNGFFPSASGECTEGGVCPKPGFFGGRRRGALGFTDENTELQPGSDPGNKPPLDAGS